MDATKATTPVTQVSVRLPRQAAIQNFAHRCTTMKTKNSSTLHRCSEFTKCPSEEVCHQAAPPTESRPPDTRTTTNDAMVSTPNTYIHEDAYAGCLSGRASP